MAEILNCSTSTLRDVTVFFIFGFDLIVVLLRQLNKKLCVGQVHLAGAKDWTAAQIRSRAVVFANTAIIQ